MHHMCLRTAAVLFVLACAVSPLLAVEKFWRSYAEFETRGGDPWAAQGNLVLPLHQTEVNMLFADFRGNWTDAQAAHGNYGLAFRQMIIHDWIFGIHAAYDSRHSDLGNNFSQATLGLELLNENWGLRWNGYFAGEGPKLLPSMNSVSLIGNNLFIQQAAERAYSGTDFEIEKRLWYFETPADGRWQHWVSHQVLELWGAIGVFHFENDAAAFEDITGPRARLELRMFDIPLVGPDSRLVFSGEFEHDDVRGSTGTGMLTLRIPFGPGTRHPRGLLRGLNRRMVAPIMRNTDIISVAGFESSEPAAFARTGQAISQVLTVDANTVSPETVVAGAGNNSLVIVDGSEGTILPGGTIDAQQGQVLLGGGSGLAVSGLNSGATAIFNAPGSRPTINSAGATTFTVGNDSTLRSMDVTNSGNNISGVLLNNSTGALIDDLDISTSGISSAGILSTDSRFAVANSNIRTSGQFGNGLSLSGTSVASVQNTSFSTSGPDAEGIRIAGNSYLNLQGSRVFTSGATGSEGILATESAQLVVGNSVITTTGPSTIGLLATPGGVADNLSLLMSNTTINTTSHGAVLGGTGFNAGTLNATISGNTIIAPTGLNEIDAQTNGTATLNLSALGNRLDPIVGTIRLNEVSGDMNVTQSAPGSGETGIDTRNGLPPTNVLIPGNPVDFDELPPIGPEIP